MKTPASLVKLNLVIATALLITAVGCKKEEPTAKAVESTKTAASDIGSAVKDVTAKGVEKAKEGAAAVKTGVEKAVEAVKTEVKSLTAPTTDKAQEIINKAQSLVTAGDFREALIALNSLNGMTLTDAQKKIVAGIKAQIIR